MQRTIHIGIDGDGTLYANGPVITKNEIRPLIEVIAELKEEGAKIYHTTGRDITFLRHLNSLYPDVMISIDFHILENGGVFYDGTNTELMIPQNDKKDFLNDSPAINEKLEKISDELTNRGLSQHLVTKGQTSLAYRGPKKKRAEDLGIINDLLLNEMYSGEFDATMSEFAVFIKQSGISKWVALNHLSENEVTCTIGDSVNDLPSLTNASYGFIPVNATPALFDELKKKGFNVRPLSDFSPSESKIIYKANSGYTTGLVEILRTIRTAYHGMHKDG